MVFFVPFNLCQRFKLPLFSISLFDSGITLKMLSGAANLIPFCSFVLFFIVNGQVFSSGSLIRELTSGSRMQILIEHSPNLGQAIKPLVAFFAVGMFFC